jgi:uncharacterized protein (DUF1015 family)
MDGAADGPVELSLDDPEHGEPVLHPPAASGRPLVLAPFRGLRFDAERVGDLGTVVSPPYDVLDAETVRALEAANHHNIVRLILSRGSQRPYEAVAKRLQSWRDKRYLRPDDEQALYLYQYTVEGVSVRGLIGLVGLREEDERVILPHEGVMPGPVEDRSMLMATTRTNLEPILLVHEGTTGFRSLLDAMTDEAPVADFTALDGSAHVLWRVSRGGLLADVATELAHGRALIADGHHRYAAYLELQHRLRDPSAPDGQSPWDYGLALLVDQHHHPLHVGPIHRSVLGLTLAEVESAHRRGSTSGKDLGTGDLALGDLALGDLDFDDRRSALAALEPDAGDAVTSRLVVTDGRRWAVVTAPRALAVDAAVLHSRLLPAWGVSEDQIGYHHDLGQALERIARRPGIVVAVRPPGLGQVMEAASRGIRLPRKSTSFGPKPRMGLVMRDLRDGSGTARSR